jgi:hypothetical protein
VEELQSEGCGEWWNDEGSAAAAEIGIWDQTFFLPWPQLSDDYRIIDDWTAGGSSYSSMLNTALVVIDDGDWDPASSTSNQALYDARPGLVDTLSVELSSVPGAYLEQTYEFDLSECSEEATMLLDTRTGAVLVVHQFQNC